MLYVNPANKLLQNVIGAEGGPIIRGAGSTEYLRWRRLASWSLPEKLGAVAYSDGAWGFRKEALRGCHLCS